MMYYYYFSTIIITILICNAHNVRPKVETEAQIIMLVGTKPLGLVV